MRLYRGIAALEAAARPRVVTIGVFDGLHAGHEAILARTRAEADAVGESCLVFTFEPTPKEFFAARSAAAPHAFASASSGSRRSASTSCCARASAPSATSARRTSSSR